MIPSPAPFVVLSDDWGDHPSSCQHLFRRIAREHRTLWVNTLGLRPPRLSLDDARRAARKLAHWRRAAPQNTASRTASLDLTVLAPPMAPWMRPAPLRALNAASVRRSLLRAAAALGGLERPVLVVTVPNGIQAAGVLGERALVYYCVDDFTRWPGVDGASAEAMERELLARADMVIATSESLAASRARPGLPMHLLPHGVDVEHLALACDAATQPLEGVRRGRPVLGLLGLIDERTDATLVARIARARRDWDIVLVGPVDRVPGELRGESNIRSFPAVAYADVPRALAAFDVAILPYARNALTEAINPLKLREYIASGRPIVATPLPEVARFAPHVRLATDAGAWVRELDAALAGPRDLRSARLGLLASDSWEARAERFLALCADAAHEPVATKKRAGVSPIEQVV